MTGENEVSTIINLLSEHFIPGVMLHMGHKYEKRKDLRECQTSFQIKFKKKNNKLLKAMIYINLYAKSLQGYTDDNGGIVDETEIHRTFSS